VAGALLQTWWGSLQLSPRLLAVFEGAQRREGKEWMRGRERDGRGGEEIGGRVALILNTT